ncbi:alanine racemase [Noviherbaspirillum sp.]|uniref:alanine racemase n=1 Tax=Noviherbaspirillum sp. TaxID=1926288 RepID=UPI002D680540|nr:alanine racemase [Noviherbaspirillum sp.]HZW21751.1 alanine racemase [Noviherbaspirillum sp.]
MPTPAVILDRSRLQANCERMAQRAAHAGVSLRPHLKTAKSAEVARIATAGQTGGITVSTLAELAYFFDAGFRDMTYAVGIVPSKLPAIARFIEQGARINVVLDSVRAADEIAGHAGAPIPVLIEIDCGGHRAGVAPESSELIDIAERIASAPGLRLEGVLTHAGHSYHAADAAARGEIAIAERDAALRAAERIRGAGMSCPTVSIGSTPTALTDISLDGVTEIRPGVYVFFDLSQARLGVCGVDDIAVSVLATVIGHHREAGHLLVDAGALALSKDISANEYDPQVGYGLVCDIDGQPVEGLHVADVHQEHGFVRSAAGDLPFDRFPVGTQLRILPNHACMTVAPYREYHVLDAGSARLTKWSKTYGW